MSYTYSVLKDNQIGENNFYSQRGNGVPVNNYNYISSAPGCTTTSYAACFNPLVDYGYGILDVPHRVIIAPIWQLPFGKDRRWATSGVANAIAGGWTVAAVINMQSGFPIGLTQTDNTLLGGANRPNLTGTGFETPGELSRTGWRQPTIRPRPGSTRRRFPRLQRERSATRRERSPT